MKQDRQENNDDQKSDEQKLDLTSLKLPNVFSSIQEALEAGLHTIPCQKMVVKVRKKKENN